MADLELLRRILKRFRSRRMSAFQKIFQITRTTRVLDVGGSAEIWQHASILPHLTIVNLPSALQTSKQQMRLVGADGCMLPFRDKEFDIVFSNSVVEHLGSLRNQQKFASEIARVGRFFWVQTPNKAFPVEQHMILPFVHQLPRSWQSLIVNRVTGWELLVRPTEAQRQYYIQHFLNELRLLSVSDLQSLFPGARVIHEKLFGLTKSLIAVRS